jgi:hypothetical protein
VFSFTGRTFITPDDGIDGHFIARFKTGNTFSHFSNYPTHFVAGNKRHPGSRMKITGKNVHVGSANTGKLNAHQNFAGFTFGVSTSFQTK